jgi:tetratricopeptide (TPR) repeat protein
MNDTPHGLEVLRTYGEGFAGRQAELAALDQAWAEGTRIFVLHAEGGAGKTRVVAKWLTQMRDDGYRGAGRVFVHSFYSQGSNERRNASSELFFEQALAYFGYTGPLITDPTEQGRTLARLIRGLLVLDGLEPLQHPPSFDQGRLKDLAIRSLFLALAAGRLSGSSDSPSGLCVVTSRQPVQELQDKTGRAVVQQLLDRLDAEAGAELLRQLEVRGPERELRQAVEDSGGHAYSLMLLGTYLRDATEDHEIRRRHEIPLLDEDSEHRYHARHLFGAYVNHLGETSPEVAVLRLLGFFDRPAEENLVNVLREAAEPELDAITAPIRNLFPADWRRALSRLKVLRLVDVPPSASSPLDSHPLLREYFAEQLRTHFPGAWRAGHRQLFEHLCETTMYRPDTLIDLQPLYQAVAHGCLAGSPQKAYEVYYTRIHRRSLAFPVKQLGAINMDLACITNFFEQPWTRLRSELSAKAGVAIFDNAAENLHSLTRITEAQQAMNAFREFATRINRPGTVPATLILLSELSISKGDLSDAKSYALNALAHSTKHEDLFNKQMSCVAVGIAARECGEFVAARKFFEQAEQIQSERNHSKDTLVSVQGYEYCELIYNLARLCNTPDGKQRLFEDLELRARHCLEYGEKYNNRLAIGLANLAASLASTQQDRLKLLNDAVEILRGASDLRFLPRALVLRSLALLDMNNVEEATSDLEAAQSLAERGPMPMLQVDILLAHARLFRDRAALAEARRLIEKHGYHRRDEELADAEAAAKYWKDPSMPTKTFISYSHDSEQHSQRVLALANQLRAQGIDAEIDQYETRPPQGWPRWCEEKLRPENFELVLVVCTETYLKRIEGKVSADEGRGVFWEGSIIYSYLYEEKNTERFLPVIFDRKDDAHIPRPLRGATRYLLSAFDLSDSGYESLYRELTHQPAIERPPLGEVVNLRRGGVSFERSMSDTQVLPPVPPRKARTTFPTSSAAPPAPDLLEELKVLPAAWFEELVYRFDKHNAASAKPAPQSIRAIELLNIVRATADGPDRLREEIRRLKGSR